MLGVSGLLRDAGNKVPSAHLKWDHRLDEHRAILWSLVPGDSDQLYKIPNHVRSKSGFPSSAGWAV